MSGFGDSVSRKLYQAKTKFGGGQKTRDSDLDYAKTRFLESEKKFKNVLMVVQKLASTIHATNLMQVEVLTSLVDVNSDKGESCNNLNRIISTFQRIDEGVSPYEQRLETDILVPMKTYLEQYTIMRKRLDIAHKRQIDMDRFHDSVLSISKKPPGKQAGLAEAQSKYNSCRDLYHYLRDEIIVDVNNLVNDTTNVITPIAGTLVAAYTDYLNHLNSNWGDATEVLADLAVGPVDTRHTITPSENSMMIDANVFAKKNDDISAGTYQGDDEFSHMTTSTTSSTTASTAQKKRPPPPPTPNRASHDQPSVRCEYDYQAQEEGELSFHEGDIITVLKKDGDWWLGTLNGVQGIFPSNYVTQI